METGSVAGNSATSTRLISLCMVRIRRRVRRLMVTARRSLGMEREYSHGSFSLSGMRQLRSMREGFRGAGSVSLPRPPWQDGAVRFRGPGVARCASRHWR
ncbi:hypothetical protein GCM10027162_48320 [Streptomyces incanus]